MNSEHLHRHFGAFIREVEVAERALMRQVLRYQMHEALRRAHDELMRALREATEAFAEAARQIQGLVDAMNKPEQPSSPNPYHRLHMERRRRGRWW